LEAFELAKKYGADGIEFDVSQTKDKQNIIAHGEYLTETTCPTYKPSDCTLAELKEKCTVKNGEPIMTLEEMLDKVKGMFDYYFVEIKVYTPADAEQQTMDAIQTVLRLGMQDQVIFTSYDKTATYLI
jgi:glycerophosphoryl diester phosphodiesterase